MSLLNVKIANKNVVDAARFVQRTQIDHLTPHEQELIKMVIAPLNLPLEALDKVIREEIGINLGDSTDDIESTEGP